MTFVDPLIAGPIAAASGVARLTEAARDYLDSLIAAVPMLVTALVVLILFWIGAGVARNVASTLSEQVTDDENLKSLFGTIARLTVIIVGLFVTASILFPGLKAGDLVAVLGLSSVAIGFAFKDIFENFLAGILILIQRPFHIDDQIVACGYEGVVEDIKIRSTMIRTFDGERVIIPNSDIYSSAVRVKTAYEKRRTTFETGIGYDEDVEKGRQTILEALESVESILDDPSAEAVVNELGGSAVIVRGYYWINVFDLEPNLLQIRSQALNAVKENLLDAGFELPGDIVEIKNETAEESFSIDLGGKPT
jgi:small-conductance mechanosensitive channel